MGWETTVFGPANKKNKAKLKHGIDLTRLPDEILGNIVSHLPTSDGARTAAISRRWRHLWRLAPLNLDDGHIPRNHQPDRTSLVPKLLSEHLLPVRRLKLYRPFDDAWLAFPALDNLEEIDIWICQGRRRPLPVLRFAPTLRVAILGSCVFPQGAAPACFPRLTKLVLSLVEISSDTLHGVLAGGPVLERLVMECCSGLTCPRISSRSLRSVVLLGDGSMDELTIEDAPRMERLIRSDQFATSPVIRIIRAPKLLILGSLPDDDLARLKLGTAVPREIDAAGKLKTLMMRSVKVLRLTASRGPNLHAVVGFLKLFPCLEKLYMRSLYQWTSNKSVGCLNPRDHVDCLDHLKEVGLKFYAGTEEDVNFAKYFVLNARVLQLMQFGVRDSVTEEWRATQHILLQFDGRASRGARLDFRTDRQHNIYICDVCRRTLSMACPSSTYCGYCGQFDQMDTVL